MKPNQSNQFLLLFIAVVAIVFSFGLHPRAKFSTWEGPLWADGAGYFVYLPASFYYGFDAKAFPENIERQMGLGFALQDDGKVFTKYTYGVALMQLPVYALIDGWVRLKEAQHVPRGFTTSHQRTVLLAPVLWLLLGLWWLLLWLQKRFRAVVARWVVVALFLGSHLFYYTIDSGAMSHVYSFALFSALLALLDRTDMARSKSLLAWLVLLIGFVAGLILVIRPTNAIFLLFAFLAGADGWRTFGTKFAFWLTPLRLILLAGGMLLALAPQLVYWKYLSGNWIYYSYQEEGFNWLNPAILKFLFSPAGGLFVYAPIYWLIVPGWWLWLRAKPFAAAWALLCFLLATYVFSCWHSWSYGGSFGARPLVEYLVLSALPLAFYVKACVEASKTWRISGIALLLILSFWSVKFTLSFNKYFFGTGDWDWDTYLKILLK